jgi:hypothetical protein
MNLLVRIGVDSDHAAKHGGPGIDVPGIDRMPDKFPLAGAPAAVALSNWWYLFVIGRGHCWLRKQVALVAAVSNRIQKIDFLPSPSLSQACR